MDPVHYYRVAKTMTDCGVPIFGDFAGQWARVYRKDLKKLLEAGHSYDDIGMAYGKGGNKRKSSTTASHWVKSWRLGHINPPQSVRRSRVRQKAGECIELVPRGEALGPQTGFGLTKTAANRHLDEGAPVGVLAVLYDETEKNIERWLKLNGVVIPKQGQYLRGIQFGSPLRFPDDATPEFLYEAYVRKRLPSTRIGDQFFGVVQQDVIALLRKYKIRQYVEHERNKTGNWTKKDFKPDPLESFYKRVGSELTVSHVLSQIQEAVIPPKVQKAVSDEPRQERLESSMSVKRFFTVIWPKILSRLDDPLEVQMVESIEEWKPILAESRSAGFKDLLASIYLSENDKGEVDGKCLLPVGELKARGLSAQVICYLIEINRQIIEVLAQ